ARRLFAEPAVGFLAALLLMFSGMGFQVFVSYLLFIIVPSIWFVYFLASFFQTIGRSEGDRRPAARLHLVGLTFCLMLVMSTYIPFYFLTALLTGAAAFCLVYADSLKFMASAAGRFVRANKRFT